MHPALQKRQQLKNDVETVFRSKGHDHQPNACFLILDQEKKKNTINNIIYPTDKLKYLKKNQIIQNMAGKTETRNKRREREEKA